MKFKQLISLFGEVRFEISKVVWPNTRDALSSSLLVSVVVLVASLLCLAVDSMMYKFVGLVFSF